MIELDEFVKGIKRRGNKEEAGDKGGKKRAKEHATDSNEDDDGWSGGISPGSLDGVSMVISFADFEKAFDKGDGKPTGRAGDGDPLITDRNDQSNDANYNPEGSDMPDDRDNDEDTEYGSSDKDKKRRNDPGDTGEACYEPEKWESVRNSVASQRLVKGLRKAWSDEARQASIEARQGKGGKGPNDSAAKQEAQKNFPVDSRVKVDMTPKDSPHHFQAEGRVTGHTQEGRVRVQYFSRGVKNTTSFHPDNVEHYSGPHLNN